MSTGTCTTHSWNDGAEDDEGEPKLGLRVNQNLDIDDDLYDNHVSSQNGRPTSRYRARLRSQRIAATTDDADDVDDGSRW